jgi:hypothetical protein
MDDKWEWVGKIETYSGKAVTFTNITEEDIELVDIVQALSNICRFNGHIPSFYSVAEHSVRAANFALEENLGKEIALTMLLHDAAEAYVGDMVRPLKRHPDYGTAHRQLEDKILATICQKLGGIWPHPCQVHQIDKQIYLWECDNIRTGKQLGWSPSHAKQRWLDTYAQLTRKTKT